MSCGAGLNQMIMLWLLLIRLHTFMCSSNISQLQEALPLSITRNNDTEYSELLSKVNDDSSSQSSGRHMDGSRNLDFIPLLELERHKLHSNNDTEYSQLVKQETEKRYFGNNDYLNPTE